MRNMAVLHSPAFSYPLPVLVRVLFNLLIFKGKILYYNKYSERLSIESPSCHTHRRSHLPKRTTRRAGATGKLLSKLLAIGEREQTENNRFPINKHRRIWLSYRGGGTDSDPHDRYLPKRESGNPASHDVLFLRIRQIGLYESAGTNYNSRAVMWKHPCLRSCLI